MLTALTDWPCELLLPAQGSSRPLPSQLPAMFGFGLPAAGWPPLQSWHSRVLTHGYAERECSRG